MSDEAHAALVAEVSALSDAELRDTLGRAEEGYREAVETGLSGIYDLAGMVFRTIRDIARERGPGVSPW